MHAPETIGVGLRGLFPPGIRVVGSLAEGDPETLSSGEAACLGRAGPKRAREFAAGRLCARQALERLGVTGWDLTVASDRTPIWPDGIVGSISHTTGFCAAAVGRGQDFRSVGLDIEVDRRVTAELHAQFLTPVELARLHALSPALADHLATLIFSAKEAFYKAQYPITSEWLEFADIEVRLPDALATDGEIEITPTRALELEPRIPWPWRGRYGLVAGVVATGVVFRADNNRP